MSGRHRGDAPPHPAPPDPLIRHPRLTEAAARFQAGIAHVEFRRMVERAVRRLDEDRKRREVADLLSLARLVGGGDTN